NRGTLLSNLQRNRGGSSSHASRRRTVGHRGQTLFGAEDRAWFSFRLRRSKSAEAILRLSRPRTISSRRPSGCHQCYRTHKVLCPLNSPGRGPLHADLGVGLVVLSQSFLKSALLAPGECVNPPHTKQKARADQAGPLRSTLSHAG